MTRYARQIDKNQTPIAGMLEMLGYSTFDMHRLGCGFPDLAVGGMMPCPHCGQLFPQTRLIEIKNGVLRFTDPEKTFFDTWRGQVAWARNLEEALGVLGR